MSDISEAIDNVSSGVFVTVSDSVDNSNALAGHYSSLITGEDGVYIIVLPEDVGVSAEEVAADALEEIPGDYGIVAVVVGRTTASDSKGFTGDASDLMFRADAINNTATGAVDTFIELVHREQATTVQTVSDPPSNAATGSGIDPAPLIGGGVIGLALIGTAVFLVVKRFSKRTRSVLTTKKGITGVDTSKVDPSDWDSIISALMSMTPSNFSDTQREMWNTSIQWLRQISSNWEDMVEMGFDKETLTIALEYMPKGAKSYEKLPWDLLDKRVNGTSRSASMTTLLARLSGRLSELRDASYGGTIEDFQMQEDMISARYGDEFDFLGLDPR